MNSLGWYNPPDGNLELGEFMATNFENLAAMICPDKVPEIIFASLANFGGEGIITGAAYFGDEITVALDGTGKSSKLSNVFVVDRDRLPDFFAQQIAEGDINNLIMALWQLTLHELRHFVQNVRFNWDEARLVTCAVIVDVEARRAEIAQSMRNHVEVYAKEDEPIDRVKIETDAIVVSWFAMMAMLANYSPTSDWVDEQIILDAVLVDHDRYHREREQWLKLFETVIKDVGQNSAV